MGQIIISLIGILYPLLPIDLIPDLLPVPFPGIGLIDDIVAFVWGVYKFRKNYSAVQHIIRKNRKFIYAGFFIIVAILLYKVNT